MIPNALVIAFDGRVRFEPHKSVSPNGSRVGTLVIPIDPDGDETERPGWIVDGQQRTAALREARIDSFPIFVTAFVTDADAEQRAQFILVNSTRPLPKSLIYELLPTTEGALPINLEVRRLPARLLERLNRDHDSPLEGLIKTPPRQRGTSRTTPCSGCSKTALQMEPSIGGAIPTRLTETSTRCCPSRRVIGRR